MKREQIFGVGIALVAILILWLLNKLGLLHESTSAAIVTGAGTTTSQAVTGLPQFDLRDSTTFSSTAYQQSVWPICGLSQGTTAHPAYPSQCTCPSGFTLFHEVSQDSYLCLPNGVIG